MLSSGVVLTVANVSANVCQFIACNPERLESRQVLDLIFCFPFYQLRHLTLCLWTFFCFPPLDPVSSSSSSSSDLSDSSSSAYDFYRDHSD